MYAPPLISALATLLAVLSLHARGLAPPQKPSAAARPVEVSQLPNTVVTDVSVVLGQAEGDYLAARRRLHAAPDLAVPAITDRLGNGTLDPAQRRRLLHALVELRSTAAAPWLKTELRTALVTGQDATAWMSLVRRLPDEGEATLLALVGDTELSISAREGLLEPLISTTSDPARFVPLVGRGNRRLERALRRLLRSRATLDAKARGELIAALDAQISSEEVSAGAVLLRGAIGPVGRETQATLIALATSSTSSFDVSIACLAVLGDLASTWDASPPSLLNFARTHLAPERRDQAASALLGGFALTTLADADARTLIAELDLLSVEDPRLHALALQRADLGPMHRWLATALEDPWPEVQLAAMARIQAPCSPEILTTLATEARAESTALRKVERAAIRSLGRCGPSAVPPLGDLMSDTSLAPWKRADAAAQIARLDPRRVVDVAALMSDGDDALVVAILQALQSVDDPPTDLVRAACRLTAERPKIEADARRTLKAWGARDRCP